MSHKDKPALSGPEIEMALRSLGLDRSFMDDSLDGESGNSPFRPSTASLMAIASTASSSTASLLGIAPEFRNVVLPAFGIEPVEREPILHLGLFPLYILNLVMDKSSPKNRLAGIEKLENWVYEVNPSHLMGGDLGSLVELFIRLLCDSNVKVVQQCFQLLTMLDAKLGPRLDAQVPSIIRAVLVKMGTNKYIIRQTAMLFLKRLTTNHSPQELLAEVIAFGIGHKTSRVREESLNIITATLIRCSNDDFNLLTLFRETVPALCDPKARVRQAAFELIGAIYHFQQWDTPLEMVSLVIDMLETSKREENGASLLEAVKARIGRRVIAKVTTDYMLSHAVVALRVREDEEGLEGLDVDWILLATQKAGAAANPAPSSSSEKGGRAQPQRMHKSTASKKLPWGEESGAGGSSVGPLAPVKLHNSPKHRLAPVTLGGGGGVEGRRESSPGTYNTSSAATSSTLQTVYSLPPSLQPTTRAAGPSYAGMYGNRLPTSLSNGFHPSNQFRGIPNPASLGAAAMPHRPPMYRLATCACHDPTGQTSHFYSSACMGGGRRDHTVTTSHFQPHATPQVSPTTQSRHERGGSFDEGGSADDLSMTWPRVMRERSGGGSGAHITADASALAEGGPHSSPVYPSGLRPLSKPRVRNPITSLKQLAATTATAAPPPDHAHQTEQEFLAWDEEYYEIPEDTCHLDSSLSSSLSSLCAPNTTRPGTGTGTRSGMGPSTSTSTGAPMLRGEVDKLKHIRKQAASRKAQLISASTSPDLSAALRHSSGDSTGSSNSPAMRRFLRVPTTLTQTHAATTALTTTHAHSSLPHDAHYTSSQPRPLPSQIAGRRNSDSVLASVGTSGRNVNLNQTFSIATTSNGGAGSLSEPLPPLPSLKPGKKRTPKARRADALIGPAETPGELARDDLSLLGRRVDASGEGSAERKPRRKPCKDDGDRAAASLQSRQSKRLPLDRQATPPSDAYAGTDFVDMEVGGEGSGGPAPSGHTPSLSQATKDSLVHRKRKRLEERRSKTSVGPDSAPPAPPPSYPSSKPPLPPLDTPAPSTPLHDPAPPRGPKPHARGRSFSEGSRVTGEYGARRSAAQQSSSAIDSPNASTSQMEGLQPFGNADHTLREALVHMASDEWSIKCDGLTAVSQLAQFHPDVLEAQLGSVVTAVQAEVKNLRSCVSRAAINCLGQLFAVLGRAMEPMLDRVVKTLLHKGGESNQFIREDVVRALTDMIASVNPSRSLASLIAGGLSHRNIQVRKMTSQLLFQSVEQCGPDKLLHSSRDVVERALVAVIQLMGDNSPDARYYGRRCLDLLCTVPEFERVLSRTLSGPQLTKARDAVENLRNKGVGDPPHESHSAKHSTPAHLSGGALRSSNGSRSNKASASQHRVPTGSGKPAGLSPPRDAADGVPMKRSRKPSQERGGELVVPLPDGLCERLKAHDWMERLEAVEELNRFVNASPRALVPHLHRVFDVFGPRLTDRNSKVNVRSLDVFSNIVPLLGNDIAPILSNAVTALVPNLASRNPTIHANAVDIMELMSQCIDPVHLTQTFANHGQYGNTRVQPIMITMLANITPFAYREKPQQVARHILPVMWHLLNGKASAATSEAKEASVALCRALHTCMGEGLVESAAHLQPSVRQRLLSMLAVL